MVSGFLRRLSGDLEILLSQSFRNEKMSNSIPMINEVLTILRLYHGFTQNELSEEVGISQSVISELEKGRRPVSLEILEKYSQGLGVKKSQLMFFAEELEGHAPIRRGKLIVARKALNLLKKIGPKENVA